MSRKEKSKRPVLKLIVLAVVIGLLGTAKFLSVEPWLTSFNDWVSAMGTAGIFIFIGAYAVTTVLLLPGLILTLGAGFAFGLWRGFLAVSAGSNLGAALAFLVARFLARDKVKAIVKGSEKFQRIDDAIGKQGAKLVFLLRLGPAIPFNVSNYIYGLTGVKFWPYVLASWLGMMPGTFLYVSLGRAGKAAASAAGGGAAHGWQYWTLMSVGLASTIALTVWVTKIARDALKKGTEVE